MMSRITPSISLNEEEQEILNKWGFVDILGLSIMWHIACLEIN